MVAHEGHDMSSMAGMDMDGGSSGSSSMGMSMFFFTSTTTPLYSEAWTPASAGAYAGTCIFLIILAILLRALFTAKTFLEYRALQSAMKRRYIVAADQQTATDKAFNDASSMTGILTTNGLQENVRIVEAPARHVQPFRFSVDLPRAAIMTLAAGVGYLLMLAVMTYNVGYFLSVLAGAFIGELALGRFNQSAMSM
ncbi:Ctr copper transporter-like protein [Paraphaeosphaeria sporulosa]|uniref:Copper transport protein n=1 Tax=Paraphaeosphaeria sporulosa TaxID=1460663 RepID=A0A177CDZ8_9PLEO|nr:Ctr copper transporter-like protein [Paraphaeosphaeria sporulosa]OAG04987.1 Ctr copper transporter-like protein [Paraphaeosphaeria sporulosa]